MTGPIETARAQLAAALDGAAGTVLEKMPDRITPPAVLLKPADPWITKPDDVPYRLGLVHYELTVIVPTGTATSEDDALTAATQAVLQAVVESPGDWALGQVSAPIDLGLSGVVYPAVKITVSIPAPLTTT